MVNSRYNKIRNSTSGELRGFTLSDMQIAFYTLCFGFTLSTLTFIYEFVSNKALKKKMKKNELKFQRKKLRVTKKRYDFRINKNHHIIKQTK